VPKPEIPPGCVLIRLADLAVLLASRPAQPPAGSCPAEPARPSGDAWSGLAIAVAMVTARLGHHDVDPGHLAAGTDAASIIRPLAAMASAGIRGCLEDGAEGFLRDMGLIAAARGRGPDGEPL